MDKGTETGIVAGDLGVVTEEGGAGEAGTGAAGGSSAGLQKSSVPVVEDQQRLCRRRRGHSGGREAEARPA